jgi:hypothetical protein
MSLPTYVEVEDWGDDGFLLGLVSCRAVLMRVRVLLGVLQEIEEMRRRLRELEKLEFEIPPAASHGNLVANTPSLLALLVVYSVCASWR